MDFQEIESILVNRITLGVCNSETGVKIEKILKFAVFHSFQYFFGIYVHDKRFKYQEVTVGYRW